VVLREFKVLRGQLDLKGIGEFKDLRGPKELPVCLGQPAIQVLQEFPVRLVLKV